MADDTPAGTDLGIEGLSDAIEIGVGGFATVYKAYQPAFRRTVAVKVLATHNLDQESRDRFERECQAMGSLSDHPNIVTVYGAGFTESSQSRPYLVMAYLAGGSLADRVAESGPMAWQDASLYGVHLAGALETAHQASVVHRDIKPANVLMSAFGDAMLTDFGIARISGGHETRSGVITASMHHAPPEVIDGQRPNVVGDVYSLASTLVELMIGRAPFALEGDEGMVPMIRRILTEPPPDLRPLGVPPQLCATLERALAKDPGERQPSAVEFGRELQAARRASGLEGGKLTVPSAVSESGEVSFTAAPSQVLCQTCHAEVPPGSDACPSCGAPVGPAVRPAVSPATAPAPVAAWTPAGSTAPHVGEAAAAGSSGGGAGKWVALGLVALLVFVLGAGGVFVLLGGDDDEVASDRRAERDLTTHTGGENGDNSSGATGVTETTDTTVDPDQVGFTPQVERNFINACEEHSSREFCRCLYDSLREEISFDRFLEIEQLAAAGDEQAVAESELTFLAQECNRQFPADGAGIVTG
ncbi:MAG: protein kinase [Acidimicrobiia bacterium]|nr:protein kinase [Acidimicrobiia bacterium]